MRPPTQPVSASVRAPPRLRIVGTQRHRWRQFTQLRASVTIAHMGGDDSPRVIQAVDPDTESVASSGFLRMLCSHKTWRPILQCCRRRGWIFKRMMRSLIPSCQNPDQVGESCWCRRVRTGHLNHWVRHLEDSGKVHNDERPFADHVRLPDSDTETVGAVSDVSCARINGGSRSCGGS